MATKQWALAGKGFSDFAPVDFGFEDCRPGKSFGPHVRGYYLIHYVEAGCGEFISPCGTFPVGAGEAFLIRPGEVCTYKASASDPWHYTWIGFVGRLSSAFDRLDSVFPIDGALFAQMRALPETMAEEYLCAMLFLLYRALFAGGERPDYVSRAMTFIHAHYMEDISVAGIAEALSLSRKYLSRLFHASTGKTLQDFLIERRMSEAAHLLKEGYSVAEVAQLSGYRDSFTFSRAFKARMGKSPRAWKKDG